MSIVHILFVTTIFILNYIEFSLQFDCLPNGEPIPGVSCGKSPSSSTSTLDRHDFPECSYTPTEHLVRARSRSRSTKHFSPDKSEAPPVRLDSPQILGFSLEELRFIRIIPRKNQQRIFELRRYTFPSDKFIKMRKGETTYEPITNQELIVLSASDGDVYATLDHEAVFAGMYINIKSGMRRMKINMGSGTITRMSREEIYETPVGPRRNVMASYEIKNVHPPVELHSQE